MGWSFYNSSGQLLTAPASTASADLATEATNVTVTQNDSESASLYPVFVDGLSSTQGIETDAGLTYNPSSGLLTAAGFSGPITGNLTGALQTAAQTNITEVGTITAGTWQGTTVAVNQGGTGITSFGSNVATFLGTPSSANLRSALTDETGTGGAVFASSPTLVTPALGTPSALVGTNISGTASSLTAGAVTTNANLTGHVTSSGNAAVLGSFTSAQLAGALTNETGSGAAVFGTSPTLATPVLGTPQSGDLSNCTGAGVGLGLVIALS
jgi:hypothetical protein